MLDLDADPTPGDPFSVRQLARRYLEFAADVEYARGQVESLHTGGAVESWLGEAGDAFREELAEFPEQLRKLETSYRMAGDALTAYEPILAAAQIQADRALARGRDARFQRDNARNLLGPAQAALATDTVALADLSSTSSSYPMRIPPSPDPAQVAQASRNRAAAQARLDQIQGAVQDGQSELDAARRLALSAEAMRADAAKVCVQAIRAASDAGIRNKPWYSWERIGNAAGKVWTSAVQVAKITVAVLGVVALIVGGPAAWVVFAAAVVVLADTLMEYDRGRASRWDVAFALLGVVPGTKGLTTVGALVQGVRGGSRAVAGIRSAADAGKLLLGGGRALAHGGQEMALGAIATGRQRLASAAAAVRRAVTDPAGTAHLAGTSRAARTDIVAGSDPAAAAAVRTTSVRFPENTAAHSTNRTAGEAGEATANLDRAADTTITTHPDKPPSTTGPNHADNDHADNGHDSGGNKGHADSGDNKGNSNSGHSDNLADPDGAPSSTPDRIRSDEPGTGFSEFNHGSRANDAAATPDGPEVTGSQLDAKRQESDGFQRESAPDGESLSSSSVDMSSLVPGPLGDFFRPGIHGVIGDVQKKEIDIARVLVDEGSDVRFLPADHTVRNQQNPDVIVRSDPDDPGLVTELKTLESSSKNAIRRNILKAGKQTSGDGGAVIDGRQVGLRAEDAYEGIKKAWGQAAGGPAADALGDAAGQPFPAQVRIFLGDGSSMMARKVDGGILITRPDGSAELRGG
ncbi:hypothetical protein [Frankia sp. CiP1_Cm_nod1]|uniref:hypothetical protein n=1 Tax=Frankia sp. CiP1_Cm_nod1 TaxID=2897160 RepID=UPI0020257839